MNKRNSLNPVILTSNDSVPVTIWGFQIGAPPAMTGPELADTPTATKVVASTTWRLFPTETMELNSATPESTGSITWQGANKYASFTGEVWSLPYVEGHFGPIYWTDNPKLTFNLSLENTVDLTITLNVECINEGSEFAQYGVKVNGHSIESGGNNVFTLSVTTDWVTQSATIDANLLKVGDNTIEIFLQAGESGYNGLNIKSFTLQSAGQEISISYFWETIDSGNNHYPVAPGTVSNSITTGIKKSNTSMLEFAESLNIGLSENVEEDLSSTLSECFSVTQETTISIDISEETKNTVTQPEPAPTKKKPYVVWQWWQLNIQVSSDGPSNPAFQLPPGGQPYFFYTYESATVPHS